jgi:hypothetical protein
MADVMLEDTRIHHLDLGLPDADVIPAAARLPAAGRHVGRAAPLVRRTASGDRPGPEGLRRHPGRGHPGEVTANASSSNGSASKATFSC